jgi:hypothetical protein
MEAIFCYGLAFCDSEWSIENMADLSQEQINKFECFETVWNIKTSETFIKKMEEFNVLIKEWTFEDCSQLLLAHKELMLETYDYQVVGKMTIEDSETEDLKKALAYLEERVKEETGIVVDFGVEPNCVLAVNY